MNIVTQLISQHNVTYQSTAHGTEPESFLECFIQLHQIASYSECALIEWYDKKKHIHPNLF